MNTRSRKIGLALLFSALFVILSAVIIVFAATFSDEETNITWKYSEISNGRIEIDGTEFKTVQIDGATISSQTNGVVIPTTITAEDGTVYYVTKIKDSAFKDNKKLFGEITLPEKLEYIGSSAFSGSYIYGKVTIPETVKDTVDENGKITSYGIGTSAFSSCPGITEVVLPSGITCLQSSVFSNCFALNTVNTENITVFGDSCFNGCRALLNISISANTIAIKSNAFKDCHSLCGTIDLSALGTNSILQNENYKGEKAALANDAFLNCTRIEGFCLPDDNTFVNFNAFKGCSSIEGYYVKNNPDYYAFENEKDADGVLYIKNYTENEDGESVWDGTLTLYKYPLTSKREIFTVNDMVTSIVPNAFNGATSLKQINIGKGMTSIGTEAFAGSNIEFVYIPDNIKSVEFNAFKNCTKLNTVIIGEGVELVAADAFYGASSLKLIIAGNTSISPIAAQGEFYYANEYPCTNHIYGYIDSPATCESDGYYKCIACHRYKYSKATGHNGAILEIGEVSCAKDAYVVVECENCNNERFTVITEEAPGHISDGTYFTVRASHMSPGFTYSHCVVCNELFVDEYNTSFVLTGDVNSDSKIDYKDYIALEGYIADSASATEFSILNADVNFDGTVNDSDADLLLSYLSDEIDGFLFEYSKDCTTHSRKSTLEVIVASCETAGFRIRYCYVCGSLVEQINTPQYEHDLTNTTFIQATCSQAGQKVSDCAKCNKRIVEELDALPHTHNWYATSSSRGFEYSACSVCGVFEYRTVDYSELGGLFGNVQLRCKCSVPCNDLINNNLKSHINPNYYTSAYKSSLEAMAEYYMSAMTQADVDAKAEEFKELLSNVAYKMNGIPSVFLSYAPGAQNNYYDPTSILVANKDDDGNIFLEALDQNGEIKVRGRGSASHSVKSYNIKFSTDVELFGMGKSKKYSMLSLSNSNDDTRIKNALTFELSHLFGIDYSCEYRIVNVYVGSAEPKPYLLTTAVEVGENRVDIDKEYDFLLEIEYQHENKDLEKSISVTSPIFNIKFLVNEPEIEDLNGIALSKMYTAVMNIDFAIQSGDWERIQRYVDVDSLATYYVLHDYLKDIDIVWDSTRFYIKDEAILDKDGNVVEYVPKLHGGPAWDFDYSMFWAGTSGGTSENVNAYYRNNNGTLCLGETIDGKSNVIVGDSSTGEWASLVWKYNEDKKYRIFFSALYIHSEDFVKLVCEKVADLEDEMSLLYADKLNDKGISIQENIIDSIVGNTDIKNAISPNNIDKLREWLQKRNEWMQENYAAKLERLSKNN